MGYLANTGNNFFSCGHTKKGAIISSVIFTAVLTLLILIIFSQTALGVSWHSEGSLTSSEYRDIKLGDIDGDGNTDIAGALDEPVDTSVEFYTYRNDNWEKHNKEVPYEGIFNEIAVEKNEVVGANSGGNSVDYWFYNSTEEDFQEEEPDPEATSGYRCLAVDFGDLNSDGFLDIAAGYNQHGIRIFYGSENHSWTVGSSPKTSDMVKDILIADLNNDSHLDIVNTNKIGGSDYKGIEYWLGDGKDNWTHKTIYPNGDYSTIDCRDINHDGYPDVIAGSDSRAGIDVFIYKPDGSYWEERLKHISDGHYANLMLSDIDLDASFDIVGCRFDDAGINIFTNEGDGNFSDIDLGPVHKGDFRSAVTKDIDKDGFVDILGANESGLFYWRQVLPEIKNVEIPEIMYAEYENYNLSMDLSSESLSSDPYDLKEARMKLSNNGTGVFELEYDGVTDSFDVEGGSSAPIHLDEINSSRINLGNNNVRISFNIRLKWDISEIGDNPNLTMFGYMLDSKGSSGWVNLETPDFRIVHKINVTNFSADDVSLNPGSPLTVSGVVCYENSSIPVKPEHISSIALIWNNSVISEIYNISSQGFSFNITLPEGLESYGYYVYWPKISMNFSEHLNDVFAFPNTNVTVNSDYPVVTDIYITGQNYYNFNTGKSWQKSGEEMVFHFFAEYINSRDFYEGELTISNGTQHFNTTNRLVNMTFNTFEFIEQKLVPVNNSAKENPFGPMLYYDVNVIPTAIWDGEGPILLEFDEDSLRNGSEIKAEDTEVSIIVWELGPMLSNQNYGDIYIHWKIIENKNNSINGSAKMDKSWLGGNYVYSYYLPLSQAGTDDVVNFWFNGTDTIGNQIISDLWPVKCTENNPAIVLVDPIPPSEPTGLHTSSGDGYIELRWKTNPEDDIAGYRVYRSLDNESYYLFSGSDVVSYNYYKDEQVENGKKYYYKISAVDRALIPNESNLSAPVSVTPEKEKTFTEEMRSLFMDNLLVSMIFFTVLIIFGGSAAIYRSSGKQQREEEGKEEKKSCEKEAGKEKENKKTSNFTQDSKINVTDILPDQSKNPSEGTQADETENQENIPLPQIKGICPGCNENILLQQGQRFCEHCGKRIR